MSYYISATLAQPFEQSIGTVIEELKKEGFGVLTDIDVKATMKKKLNVDFRNYRILGACNPPFALKALEAEDKIGTLLPCSVIVQELNPEMVEVAVVNPVSSMHEVENEALHFIAKEIQEKLQRVITALAQKKKA
ncbi:hypothetical protein SpiGrapes_2910 [Sphaerochaeta pleomorpha str. Grapes]|uniref:DUF302 domain-containing protein n=1 Tax=Sphaerochaeta pleomorpha (strain ATCC BAA-1885 / DSM 22778 / Grapes) TaxID=158190 RepID=G8QX75_SPHPG|nr:DUF302 domain-containing protein [Sphaerochaeta pleomorpha]AEV30660.1 hypothetical protein SpiGrapes_2910 [Sphaerochaeta pleomorpha str. Grapes]